MQVLRRRTYRTLLLLLPPSARSEAGAVHSLLPDLPQLHMTSNPDISPSLVLVKKKNSNQLWCCSIIPLQQRLTSFLFFNFSYLIVPSLYLYMSRSVTVDHNTQQHCGTPNPLPIHQTPYVPHLDHNFQASVNLIMKEIGCYGYLTENTHLSMKNTFYLKVSWTVHQDSYKELNS